MEPTRLDFVATIQYQRDDVIDVSTLATKEIIEYYIPEANVSFHRTVEGELITAWKGRANLDRKPFTGVFRPGTAGKKQKELDEGTLPRNVKPGPPLPRDVVDAMVLLILMEDNFKALRDRVSGDVALVLKHPLSALKK